MPRAAPRVKVSKKDQAALKKLPSGGREQVRVVPRAVALQRLAEGTGAPRIAKLPPMTRQAVRHFTFVTPDRRGVEFAKALFQLAMSYPEAETVRLVTDHLSTHSRKPLTDPCGEESGGEIGSRFTPRHTPRHGGWLHQAEMEMGLFSRQCLGQRRIPDLAPPRRQAAAWNRRVNRERAKIDWRFGRKAARRKFGYKRPSIRRPEN